MKRASTRYKPGARQGKPDRRLSPAAAKALRAELAAARSAKDAAVAELEKERKARNEAEQKVRDLKLNLEQAKAQMSAEIGYRRHAEQELRAYRGR